MCDDREKLIAYLYDEASASERRLVDAHLVTCADCRGELRDLRSVRQDLLSWDVPEHGSVWKPFVTTQAVWWKQVPAWGLAAAATLMFGIGLAGGFAARALTTAPVIQAQAQPVASPNPLPQTVAATPEQVRALEARLASLERTSTSAMTPARGRATNVANVTGADHSDEELMRRFEQLLKDSEGRITKKTSQGILTMMRNINDQRTRDMATVSQQISDAQAAIYGNVSKVANRTAAEKEKEQ